MTRGSVRHRTERGFQDVRSRAEREPELLQNGSGYVLYALMDAIVDRYFPVLDAVEMGLVVGRAPDSSQAMRTVTRSQPATRAVRLTPPQPA